MDNEINPQQLQILTGGFVGASSSKTRPFKKTQRKKIKGRFLKGPIPLSWLTPALSLSRPAIKTALALSFQAGLQKQTRVLFNQSRCHEFGLTRFGALRGLKTLVKAGLVRIERGGRGRKATIQLLGFEETEGAQNGE